MKPSRYLKPLLALAVLWTGGNAMAQESYNAPVAGVTGLEGRRWGQGGKSDATMGGFGVFGGYRWETIRVGVLGNLQWWEGSRGVVVDTGGFISYDCASVWLDPRLSGALFIRGEVAARLQTHDALWAAAPTGIAGVRAAGFEFGLALTGEYWVSDLPNDANRLGVVAGVRLGVEGVDFVHLLQH